MLSANDHMCYRGCGAGKGLVGLEVGFTGEIDEEDVTEGDIHSQIQAFLII